MDLYYAAVQNLNCRCRNMYVIHVANIGAPKTHHVRQAQVLQIFKSKLFRTLQIEQMIKMSYFVI